LPASITVFDYPLITIDGQPALLAFDKGKLIMLVNVASRCGFTPQYSALESIYGKYRNRGFVVIGIPANNFGAQEPGANQKIPTFCETKYHVTFPRMAKVSPKASDKIPLYNYLTNTVVNPKNARRNSMEFYEISGPAGRTSARAV
jgi:glutathione peroxidase